jgi:cystathionine beta-lyase/cystathionine gamma-synthase
MSGLFARHWPSSLTNEQEIPIMAKDFGSSRPLVAPLYQASVFALPDLDAYDRIHNGEETGFTYARDGHPNAHFLAEQLAAVEGASWSVICGSGMAALTSICLALLKPGDRVVASNRLYGRTTQLLGQELGRFGVQSIFVDVSQPDQVRTALDKPAQMLLVETISNPLLRVSDLDTLGQLAQAKDCRFVVDNTFATPVLIRPLEHGADVVIESLTKMIGGHSDVTLGVACGKGDLLSQVSQVVSIWGLAANPFDCWLAQRGLATLALRMRAATANARSLADWLPQQPGVAQVIYPGRSDHPDHVVAKRLLGGQFGNMLCFELQGGRDAVNRFMRLAPNITFSPSLGHTTTTCSHPGTTSHRYVSPAERRRQGISDGLIRLSVGVEDVAQIQQDLAKGLAGSQ